MSAKIEQGKPRTRFEGIEPILNVADIAKSLKYYVNVLEDPDGHVLRFGSEPRDGRPFDSFIE